MSPANDPRYQKQWRLDRALGRARTVDPGALAERMDRGRQLGLDVDSVVAEARAEAAS